MSFVYADNCSSNGSNVSVCLTGTNRLVWHLQHRWLSLRACCYRRVLLPWQNASRRASVTDFSNIPPTLTREQAGHCKVSRDTYAAKLSRMQHTVYIPENSCIPAKSSNSYSHSLQTLCRLQHNSTRMCARMRHSRIRLFSYSFAVRTQTFNFVCVRIKMTCIH